jgi:hypothetical protein
LTRFGLSAAAVVLAAVAPSPTLAEDGSALIGSVADVKGAPLQGALISLFGKGIRGGSLVVFTDEAGRFVLSSLPAGSYTLRAIERGHAPVVHRVTIAPNQNTLYSVVLGPLVGQVSDAEAVERGRELDWLLRHKRRSVLEEQGDEAEGTSEAPFVVPVAMAGAVELMTSPGTFSPLDYTGINGTPANWSVVRLRGSIAGTGEWSVSGSVADLEGTTWRMAGEFKLESWESHSVRVGSGFGTWVPRNLTDVTTGLGAGGAFVEDRWHAADALTVTYGARYSYVGFVSERNSVDPAVAVAWQARDGIRCEAAVARRTLAPGGDLVVVSSEIPSATLSLAVTDPALRPERVTRYTVGGERDLGGTSLGVHLLAEETSDQLINAFTESGDSMRITNGRDFSTRGVAVSVGRQLGRVVGASVTYTYGTASRSDALDQSFGYRDTDFQDLAARLEAVLRSSDTRVAAFYRVNFRGRSDVVAPQPVANARFDVQVRQGLPFLGNLTRTDWDLLVAVRNLFYEEDQGGLLDEFAVINPPVRLVGGISVRF